MRLALSRADSTLFCGATQSAGTQWYIVEHDNPADPMEVAERSLRFLERLAE